MGLSLTVSEINCDFSRKSPKNSHPVYFAPLLKEFPLESVPGTGAGDKIYNDGATEPRKKFHDIFICLDTMHQRDRRTNWRTDRQMDTGHCGQQQRQRLRVASRCKNRGKWLFLPTVSWLTQIRYRMNGCGYTWRQSMRPRTHRRR